MSKSTIVALSAGLLISTSALAAHSASTTDANLTQDCSVQPCVYDMHSVKVGLALTENLLRPAGGAWYAMQFTEQGFITNANFFYADATCSTQPFMIVGDNNAGLVKYLPQWERWDGKQGWYPKGTLQLLTYKSYHANTDPCTTVPVGIIPPAIVVQPAVNENIPLNCTPGVNGLPPICLKVQ